MNQNVHKNSDLIFIVKPGTYNWHYMLFGILEMQHLKNDKVWLLLIVRLFCFCGNLLFHGTKFPPIFCFSLLTSQEYPQTVVLLYERLSNCHKTRLAFATNWGWEAGNNYQLWKWWATCQVLDSFFRSIF